MKIFNATNSFLDLPYGMNRLRIEPRSFSQEMMGTTEFIQTLVMSYSTDEVAILVGGPYELGMCASVPVSVNYVVQTTDEIVQRFGLEKKEKEEEKKPPIPEPEPEPEPAPEPEIPVVEGDAIYVGEEPEPTPEPEPAPAPKKKRTTKKKVSE